MCPLNDLSLCYSAGGGSINLAFYFYLFILQINMSTQAPIRFSSNDSYAPNRAYSPPAFNVPAPTSYVSTGYSADNRSGNYAVSQDARSTYSGVPITSKVHFNHGGSFAPAPTTTVYQQPIVSNPSGPAVQAQPQPVYVREPERQVVRPPAPSGLKQDDDFLCGKMGWILGAIIGLIILTLILLFGLGAFGGSGSSPAPAVNGPAVASPSATPQAAAPQAATTPNSTPAAGSTSVSPSPSATSSGTPAANPNSVPAKAV